MKKTVLIGICIGIVLGLVIGVRVLKTEGIAPFQNLSELDIEKVVLGEPGSKLSEIELTDKEILLLISILKEIRLEGEEPQDNGLVGQHAVFTIYYTDGTNQIIDAFAQYFYIDHVQYSTAAKKNGEMTAPCRHLENLYRVIYQQYQTIKEQNSLKSPFAGYAQNEGLKVYALMGGYMEELSDEDTRYFAQCLSGIQLMEVVDDYRTENEAINTCQFLIKLDGETYTNVSAAAPYFFWEGTAYKTFEENVTYKTIAEMYDKYAKIMAEKIVEE